MEAVQNELYITGSSYEERKLITKGYFKLHQSSSKITLKLKGDFNSNNIDCISTSIAMVKELHHRIFELDLCEAKTITMQAMALFIINLKTLEENGVHTKVIGLDRGKLKLARGLGMHFISSMNSI